GNCTLATVLSPAPSKAIPVPKPNEECLTFCPTSGIVMSLFCTTRFLEIGAALCPRVGCAVPEPAPQWLPRSYLLVAKFTAVLPKPKPIPPPDPSRFQSISSLGTSSKNWLAGLYWACPQRLRCSARVRYRRSRARVRPT